MAFSDFVVNSFRTDSVFVGGDDGSQQVNSSLSGPLTLQGDDCRVFQTSGSGENKKQWYVDPASYPDFDAVPDTKAISVRAWIRRSSSTTEKVRGGIAAKTGGVSSDTQPRGYVLDIGRLPGDGVEDGFRLLSVNSGGIIVYDSGSIISLAKDVWGQVRLDVIPVLNGGVVDRDTVRAYENTGTELSPTWTLRHEVTFIDGVDVGFRDWADATNGRVGFHCYVNATSPNNHFFYIDSFDARLKNR